MSVRLSDLGPAAQAYVRRTLAEKDGGSGAIVAPGPLPAQRRAIIARPLPLVFVMPVPPDELNARHAHWSGRSTARKRYLATLDDMDERGSFPKGGGFPPYARAVLAAELVGVRPMDDENRQARAYKAPADWLRRAHYLENDAPPAVRMLPATQRRRERWEAAHLRLTLTPVEP